MKKSQSLSLSESWPSDLLAGLVVFLVALPLCLGIALASGAPMFSGIIAGVVGGLVVAAISNSALGVSGPAAGLVVIVSGAILDLGFEVFLLAVMISGIIQIIVGYLRAGIIAAFFPTSVIKGMLAGIGIIIILKQIQHALGYDRSFEGELSFIQSSGDNTFQEIFFAFQYYSPGAVLISALSIFLLVMWDTGWVKSIKWLRMIPAPLLVVILGIALNEIFLQFFPNWAISNANGNTHLVSLPEITSLAELKSLLVFPDFSAIGQKEVYVVAITLAIVGSLESLLSLEATDKLDPEQRISSKNLELIAQGWGNICSGLIGGLPVTQVIVRSSTNIVSGGKTKLAAMFHGLFMLIFVMLIPAFLNKIPLASLSAILIMVGYKLASPALFKELYQKGRRQFIPFMLTVLGLVFTDMLMGIAIGMSLALFYILLNNYHTPAFLKKEKTPEGEITQLRLAQDVSFLNRASIALMLEEITEGSKVWIDGTDCRFIDEDVLEEIEKFADHAPKNQIQLKISGLPQLDIPASMREDTSIDEVVA
ncbi:SulP family inorganic anion transporter [Persicobacter sp. CCB-QB2]|uniref:SulP family inorganic anion transporter n=1 Tax=Persicobacter sp. CCB-QB2 TaxID=1561025 RepID=UPI0006A9A264|nr:SulP family inorganic anion transporter [Persicobacter sp. CCB-QB2]